MLRRDLPPEARAAFIAAMRDVVSSRLPEWVDTNTHDPGVTVLELFAYALEDMAARANVRDGRADEAIAHIRHALTCLERHGAPVRVSVAGEPWRQVASLDDARADDRVFTANADGIVRFGDGVHGATPPAGSDVSVTFAGGAGREGNTVTADATWPFTDAAVEVTFHHAGYVRNAHHP